jgi:hypothetical protein
MENKTEPENRVGLVMEEQFGIAVRASDGFLERNILLLSWH